MGREKKILLGFLGLLAGVFVGVLAVKLLVPRPPAGTGPDIRSDVATATAQERVEPPAPSRPPAAGGWDFAAAPPLVPEPPADRPDAGGAPATPLDEPSRFSRFAAAPAEQAPAEAPATGGGVAPVSWQRADAPTVPPVEVAGLAEPRAATSMPDAVGQSAHDPFATPRAPLASQAAPVAGAYLVQAGDSWWGVADRAYGDGRLYRALFAWNRAHDPRVSLAPGTRLDVPPLDRLQAAWPRLMPAGSR